MTLPAFAMAPYRLSGSVYGAAMNHRGAIAALGRAVHQPPYEAPPSGVVPYIKPRNTFIAAGDSAQVDATAPALEVGAALGIVIGRTACAVREADALDHVAGLLVVAYFSVPLDSFFRPQVCFKARDASCAFGAAVAPRRSVDDPDALAVRVHVGGRLSPKTPPPAITYAARPACSPTSAIS